MTSPALTNHRPQTQQGGSTALELHELRKRFGATTALDGVSFSVAPGEICGFVGANGAGKTTAMRIIMGVLPADGGVVRLGGRPVTTADRHRFGYMPEERGLYPKMRVADQLTYLARLHGTSRTEARQAAGQWTETFGLGERIGDRLEKLSLGNQQRVQLAAALVHNPDLLVLDEPFSGLDPAGVDALSEVLLERAGAGTAVLFSSHQLELVERLCQTVAVISAGRLVTSGSVRQLRAGGRRLLRVRVAGADDGWTGRVSGVRVTGTDSDGTVLELSEDADPQAVLDAARAAGAVEHFGYEQRSLAQIYREVVES